MKKLLAMVIKGNARKYKKCYSKDEGFICDEVPDVHFIFSKKMENCILRKT